MTNKQASKYLRGDSVDQLGLMDIVENNCVALKYAAIAHPKATEEWLLHLLNNEISRFKYKECIAGNPSASARVLLQLVGDGCDHTVNIIVARHRNVDYTTCKKLFEINHSVVSNYLMKNPSCHIEIKFMHEMEK